MLQMLTGGQSMPPASLAEAAAADVAAAAAQQQQQQHSQQHTQQQLQVSHRWQQARVEPKLDSPAPMLVLKCCLLSGSVGLTMA